MQHFHTSALRDLQCYKSHIPHYTGPYNDIVLNDIKPLLKAVYIYNIIIKFKTFICVLEDNLYMNHYFKSVCCLSLDN